MEISTMPELNLDKVCRVCLVEYEEMHSVFSELANADDLDDSTFVYEILTSISTMRILADDELPTLICATCMELAHTAYRFQQQCNRSQSILENYILNSKEFSNTSSLNSISLEASDKECDLSAGLDTDLINVELTLTETDVIETNVEVLSECGYGDELSCTSEGVTVAKVEVKEEYPVNELDAAEVAASEDNVKIRQRLALKRMRKINCKVKKKGTPAIGYNYFVKMTENGDKVYECSYCGKGYKHGNSLKIHMRTHTLERPYVCTLCGKAFKQYGALTYHNRSHTGEQPYSCEICGKRYKQSGTLTAHMRIHTGQRPFLCSVCGRGFRQAPDLGYHMRTHTKEKPYMCNICGKTMRMQCHLVQHMRTHTGERPFKCTECNKAFPSSTRLKRHAIIHTGLKPYTCDVCNKSFNRTSSLRVHAKIHTDERPHVCSFCGKGFIQAHALKGHLLTHSRTFT